MKNYVSMLKPNESELNKDAYNMEEAINSYEVKKAKILCSYYIILKDEPRKTRIV